MTVKPIIPPPLVTLALAGAMYGIAASADVLPFDFPARRATALAVGSVGLAIDAISVAAFFRAKTTVNPLNPASAQKLVVTGLFNFSRNPMYLGMLLLLASVFFWFGEGLNAALLALFVLLIDELQIKPEEMALEEKFGDEYRAYKKRVRRWI